MNKRQNMDDGMVIGIDIGKNSVQISCLNSGEEEPQTLTTRMGVEQFEIPMCLFRFFDSEKWEYGDQAKQKMDSEEGIYIEDLWEGVLHNREMVLEDAAYSYEQLMAVFLEQLFKLTAQCGFSRSVDAVVFTLPGLDNAKINHLQKVAEYLGFDSKSCFFVDYKESFGVYATNMSKDLWNRDVFLFYYEGRNLQAFQLRVNQKTMPFQINIGEMDFGEMEYANEELEKSQEAREEMDARFFATIQELFSKKVISTVYLIGEGFQSGWMKESLRLLCRGRRVFQGNNLFTKGACYVGECYLKRCKAVGIYQSGQMLACDVRIPMQSEARQGFLYAAKKGDPWYHAGLEMECILDNAQEVCMELVYGSYKQEQKNCMEVLELLEFPKRPRRASKIRIRVVFCNAHIGKIQVEDMGFGEFYPPSGLKWEKEFLLSGREEQV